MTYVRRGHTVNTPKGSGVVVETIDGGDAMWVVNESGETWACWNEEVEVTGLDMNFVYRWEAKCAAEMESER